MTRPSLYPYYDPRSSRRVALITAANSDVGRLTVLKLYLHGYVVYLAGRLRSRCMKTIKEIRETADDVYLSWDKETRKSRALGELLYLEVDFSLLDSVMVAASRLRYLESSLCLLIHNAGVTAQPYSVTPDGFGLQLQTNFIAPFLLTHKLLPLLERFANSLPGESPRVVYQSSVAHRLAFRYFNLGSELNHRPNVVFTWLRYAQGKTAGIHFMKMLALRNPRILCLSEEPGFVMNPSYFVYWTRLPIVGILFWCFFQIFGFFFGVTVEQAADALIYAALDLSIRAEQYNGAHLGLRGVTSPSRSAQNMDYAARSWIWTVHQLSKRHIDV